MWKQVSETWEELNIGAKGLVLAGLMIEVFLIVVLGRQVHSGMWTLGSVLCGS